MALGQRQEEIQRKKMEAEAVKENLEAQLVIVDKKKKNLTDCNSRKLTSWKQSPVCLPKKRKNAW